MRRLRYAVAALACVLAACAAQPGGGAQGPGGGPQAPPVSVQVDPVELIGTWAVEDPSGTDQGVIRLSPADFRWWSECGRIWGTWKANPAGMWVGYGFASSGPGCDPGTPDWMARAVAFRPGPEGVNLIDVDGEVTARLRPGATPPPDPNLAPSKATPPEVTDEVRERYTPPADLPSGLDPADSAALIGRWRPADRGGRAFVELEADGSWRGSDGCNSEGGRWVAGPDGLLLAVQGISTLIGCDNVPVGGWLVRAARAGLDGDDLVLVDRAGAEIGRLRAG
jgi:hypothetical protein